MDKEIRNKKVIITKNGKPEKEIFYGDDGKIIMEKLYLGKDSEVITQYTRMTDHVTKISKCIHDNGIFRISSIATERVISVIDGNKLKVTEKSYISNVNNRICTDVELDYVSDDFKFNINSIETLRTLELNVSNKDGKELSVTNVNNKINTIFGLSKNNSIQKFSFGQGRQLDYEKQPYNDPNHDKECDKICYEYEDLDMLEISILIKNIDKAILDFISNLVESKKMML